MNKRMKKYTFADGYFCYMYGMSADEMAYEEAAHGRLISVEMAE